MVAKVILVTCNQCGGSGYASGITCPTCDGLGMVAERTRLRDVACPQCREPFRLTWNDYTRISATACAKQTLVMRGCPSGGIYMVSIKCPHCDYEEEL
jgi:DnaJ-class molecular chaperone